MKDVMRLRYFENEFLDAADFEVEQEYHRSMRYWHTRHFHTWGLSYKGLEVNLAEGQETGEETKVCISPGIALDNLGREIVLTGTRILDFDQPQYRGGKSYYITIYWYEQQGLPRQDNEHKRWVEVPELGTTEEFPKHPDMNLVLARVKLRENKTIESIDGSMRRYAAHEVGNKTVTSVKIVEADGTSGQDINRGDGIKTGHIQDRAVTAVKLNEDVEKSLVPVGCVASFAMEIPPDGWLECNGQAISREDYERLFNKIGITFGAGDGETTFNTPDLRGRFVRGWAHESENDQDRVNRTASASGGASGDRVGSFQDDTLQAHIHDFHGNRTHTESTGINHDHSSGASGTHHNGHHHFVGPNWGFNVDHAALGSTGHANPYHEHYYTPQGTITDPKTGRTASETRPKNVYLMYCIKY